MPNGAQYQSVQTGYKGPWVDDVLNALGAPTTDSNRAALRAWAASEGTLWANNPLAFSGTYAGATTCIAQCGSSSPIMAYNSQDGGAANTAAFLQGNSSYQSIIAAFRNDAGLGAIFSAINGSPWCAGCQGGNYPTALHAAAGGFFGGSGSSGGGGGGSSTGSGAGGWNPSAPVLSIPHVGTVLDAGQALSIKGWFLMISGGIIGAVGLAVVLTAFGLESKAAKVVSAVSPVGRAAGAATGAASGASSTASSTAQKAQEPPRAGRRESRDIERRYRETERQQGPIGPRGGNPTANRVAQRERRGRSVQGAGNRRRTPRGGTAPAPEPF